MTAYYNEIDPYAAQWLRNLSAAGHIAPGDVDERSIADVRPDELKSYTQCHFFAGIGVWSYALRSAGWDDSRPVWTGSCPCQPFSAAGKQLGVNDERHLWPAFAKLISKCRPAVVFGEQVASAAGRDWLATVRADLEAMDYAVGAADLCAAGTGAPHIRQRLYWMADSQSGGIERGHDRATPQRPPQIAKHGQRGKADGMADSMHAGWAERRTITGSGQTASGSGSGGLADADNARQQGDGLQPIQRGRAGDGEVAGVAGLGAVGGLADATGSGLAGTGGSGSTQELGTAERCVPGRPSTPDGFWAAPDWLWCRDGKWRPVESGTKPLATGAPARVGRLRAYGNAIVPQVAEAFVRAFLKCRP